VDEIRRISHESTNRKVLALLARDADLPRHRVLDVGAGEGYFCRLLGERLRGTYGVVPRQVLRACDLYPDAFRYADVPCDRIGAAGRLPYEADSFDAVCSIEVIEHLEDQFHFARELHRVTKPGGRAIVTTPNLLNVNSRLRYLHSGFWLLFDPLPLSAQDPVHTAGHIHPVTFYYLAYLLRRAGFRRVEVHFDRRKTSAVLWALLAGAFILLGHAGFRSRLRRKRPVVYGENAALVAQVNSWDMLTCRSVILEGVK
jgi:SAM-dependent methyltransferase